jgi:ELWxxDGT repeat protein
VAPFYLAAWGGELYFGGDDGVHGVELWRSDGTAAGTRMVRDINPGGGSSNSWPSALEPLDGRLLFSADDGAHGPELWKTDGTRAGTTMVKDLTPRGRRRSRIGGIIRLGNLALFTAFGEQTLHRTDGTAGGTRIVWRPRDGGPGAIFGPGMTRVAGIGVLFEGFNRLWKSNGWRDGTVELLGFNPAEVTVLGQGRALFAADDGVHGQELWVTDGTPVGTLLVEDIRP